MGGERHIGRGRGDAYHGSSPRGRGTRSRGPRGLHRRGPVPVHPRVGGERYEVDRPGGAGIGSSPRGRGTHKSNPQIGRTPRFIPAWAGNAAADGSAAASCSVHPRVGGERARVRISVLMVSGSSPRGRGTHFQAMIRARSFRFIPAWAGNAPTPFRGARSVPVHPRVGGERRSPTMSIGNTIGSSPRGRGTHGALAGPVRGSRFIPAWAGNAEDGDAYAVRGDGSSPRGRGTRFRSESAGRRLRFIPAWAGNARGPCFALQLSAVHPRVGGERLRRRPVGSGRPGSSPRGRGTPRTGPSRALFRRFIPAWAGNARSRGAQV